jgi:hypothetical protein
MDIHLRQMRLGDGIGALSSTRLALEAGSVKAR